MPKTAKIPLRITIKPADGRPGPPPNGHYRQGVFVFNADDGILYLQQPNGTWYDFPADLQKASEASAIAGNVESKYLDPALAHLIISQYLPIGDVAIGLWLDPPLNYLMAWGQILQKNDYPDFYNWASNWSNEDNNQWSDFFQLDANTVQVPDYRAHFFRGAKNGSPYSDAHALSTYQTWQTGAHNHQVPSYARNYVTSGSGLVPAMFYSGGTHNQHYTHFNNSSGSGESRPINSAMNIAIKVR